MTGVRPTPARKVERALSQLGFVPVRSKGSHIVYRHPDGRMTVVARHAARDIPRGTLREILSDVTTTWDEFEKLL